ncbi:MAG TPA: bifunctional class I SAM-dependent methyltransferase/glycosyltransferase family 2 protein, partial [Gemmataceae bacterium]|nr:bifunctional class I SAM-dependent methyltransferase/glycosyltransferase family 2 protein [Gemmataceae bacterium]
RQQGGDSPMIETLEQLGLQTKSQSIFPPLNLETIAVRERATDRYWSRHDPISRLRLWWRAQTVRHLFHLLPGESILELGAGSGKFTEALIKATRGECPITAATFAYSSGNPLLQSFDPNVEVICLDDFPGPLNGRAFDYIVGTNLLDMANAAELLQEIQGLLRPGGRLLLFETNPWNPYFRWRRRLAQWLPILRRGDERELPSQIHLYELLSELGFLRIMATAYDFLYRPIPGWLMQVVRNLSLILENTPLIRRWAGAILLHAQTPPREIPRPPVRMVEHRNLHGGISIIVPCHNEEMNVEPLVKGLLQHYNEYIHELVLVDDNSKDQTRIVLQRLAQKEPRVKPVFRKPPNGVGRALSEGLRQATGKFVLMMDCDFLHILPELRDMFDAAAEGYEVVLGSRFSRESVLINYPLKKILCNRGFHVLASLLFHRKIRDFTNNLKLLKRNVVDNLNLDEAFFAANAETGLKPVLMGYKIKSVPVSWINRTPDQGQSSFSLLQNGWGYLKVLTGLAWRTRLGFRLLPRPMD